MELDRQQYLERCEELLFRMATLVRNKKGLHPSTLGPEQGMLLMEIRSLNGKRYDKEVLLARDKTLYLKCSLTGVILKTITVDKE